MRKRTVKCRRPWNPIRTSQKRNARVGKMLMAMGLILTGSATGQIGGSSSIHLRRVEGCRMVVPVSINGKGPYDFLLDTGAAVTLLNERVAKALGLRPDARVGVGTFTGAPALPMARVKTIRIGTESLNDLDVLYCDLRKLFSFEYGFDGVLGQDFLGRFNCLISYRYRYIWFERDGDLGSIIAGDRLPSERRQSKFYISIRTMPEETRSLRFLLDSGASDPLIFVKSADAPPLNILRFEVQPMVSRTDIGKRNLSACWVRTLKIGGLILKNLRFIIAELLPGEHRYEDGFLPMSLFDAVYFNSEQNYVILNPSFTSSAVR